VNFKPLLGIFFFFILGDIFLHLFFGAECWILGPLLAELGEIVWKVTWYKMAHIDIQEIKKISRRHEDIS
jgi:hypothetical protein